jgi:hypothetical protein
MVIAIMTAAITQPTAIHRPPNTIHSRLSRKETPDIGRYPRRQIRLCSCGQLDYSPGSFGTSCHAGRERMASKYFPTLGNSPYPKLAFSITFSTGP